MGMLPGSSSNDKLQVLWLQSHRNESISGDLPEHAYEEETSDS